MHSETPSILPRFWRDPALPFAESRSAVSSRACYRAHTHATLSIGVVDAGHSVFTSHGHSANLAPGSLVAVPAGCLHSCNPVPGEHWSYQMLYLDAAWVADTLAQAGAAPAPGHALVVRHAASYAAFCALNQRLFSDASASSKTLAIVRWLTDGLWRMGDDIVALDGGHTPAPLARVLALLQTRYAESLPLAQLAQVADMTPHALVRAFRGATGLTPHAYQLDLRINAARDLLRAGDTPAAVAQDLGFYDQSHFQNAFKQRVAATPGHYRR